MTPDDDYRLIVRRKGDWFFVRKTKRWGGIEGYKDAIWSKDWRQAQKFMPGDMKIVEVCGLAGGYPVRLVRTKKTVGKENRDAQEERTSS